MTTRGKTQRHFVLLWNPSARYTTGDAMDDHLGILLREADRRARGERVDDEVYVWWGKVRSRNRRESEGLAHDKDIREIKNELDGEGGLDREVHAYLTDYRSLYVGHVVEITYDEMCADEPELVPSYYKGKNLAVDCWLRLADIRRIVDNDLLGVIAALGDLEVIHYDNRPVSLFGGMHNLPLIVRRKDAECFFDAATRAQYTEGRLWAQADRERGSEMLMQAELRDNVVGERAWNALHPVARSFVSKAESDFRRHRGDASHNFSDVVLNIAKALEVHCNDLFVRLLSRAPAAARRVNIDGRTRDVVSGGPLTLGQLAHAMRNEKHLRDAILMSLQAGESFVETLVAVLGEIAPIRNKAAHGELVDRKTALRWRNQMLGIGCEGLISELERARVIAEPPASGKARS